MREIKFRGQTGTTEGKKWVYGNYYKIESFFNDKEAHFIGVIRNNHLIDFSIDENTLGQYTGLKDKNGKEIYEGDIVRCKQYIGGNFVEHCIEKGFIEFRNGEFGLHRKQGYYKSLNKFIEYDYKIEVIGNIWEDSDLLDDRKNKKIN